MSAPAPPEEGIDTAFWSWAYSEQPGAALLATLTDLNLHRFQLHQTLHTFHTLQETPFWHDPFQQNLPIPISQLLSRYRTHMNAAETQARRALDIVDNIGRYPPATFLLDPNSDPNQHPEGPSIHPIFPTASTQQ